MELLRARGISHYFENVLYEDLHFSLESGQSMAIMGVSGSGKSTILNNLSTMLKPKKGEVDIANHTNIYSLKSSDLLAIRRYEVGIIFQSHYLFRGFSAAENLQVASILSEEEIDINLLERFEIAHTLKQQIGQLSGGQQQRLSIARVLTKKPLVIFADEPTGNLDSHTAKKVVEVLFEYIEKMGGALVLATHDGSIAQMCQKRYLLSNATLSAF